MRANERRRIVFIAEGSSNCEVFRFLQRMFCCGLPGNASARVSAGRLCDFVSKRKDSPYRSGRSPHWLKMKNPAAPAVKREAEEDWGR